MEYIDFVHVFPKRCHEIFKSCTEITEYDITLMLMLASSAFVIPFELLKDNKSKISCELKKRVKESVFKDVFTSDTKCGFLSERDVSNEIIEIIKLQQVNFYFSLMRNALAHGNIFTDQNLDERRITTIVFLSENRKFDRDKCESILVENKPYKALYLEIEDFKKFLDIWITLLESSSSVND